MLTQNKKFLLLTLLLLLVLVELVRTAWISDDAAITLRTILNFVNGYGPNFNVGERAQSYTHPLWFLLLSIAAVFFDNIFIVTLVISILVSILTFIFLLTSIARNYWLGILSIILLSMSKAYVDFSTSGLENTLSHLIILVAIFWGGKVLREGYYKEVLYFFIALSLLYLNRSDLILIFFPLVCRIIFNDKNKCLLISKAISLAALPVIIWTLFALYYYGFPFPNTAYAKLGTGIDFSQRIVHGLNYFIDSYERDPITLTLIAIGSILGLWQSSLTRYLTLGVFFYFCYILSIGGDFMSGRFLTAPLLVSVSMIALSNVCNWIYYVVLCVSLFFALARADYTFLSASDYQVTFLNEYGISDERGFYFQQTGLLNLNGGILSLKIPSWRFLESDRDVSIRCGRLGFSGLLAGPSRYYVDECALVDPLLARLPAKYDKNWRIGHYYRQLPDGYLETIRTQQNVIADPDVKQFYDVLVTITKGDLGSLNRLKNIIRVNIGSVFVEDANKYRYTIVKYAPLKVDYISLNHSVMDDGEWDKKGSTVFLEALSIKLPRNTDITALDLSMSNSDYKIDYVSNGQVVYTTQITTKPAVYGLVRHHILLDKPIKQVDSILISGLNSQAIKYHSLGHITLN